MLAAEFADPKGYGRIVRDARGKVAAIVEEKDASAAQRLIREMSGYALSYTIGEQARMPPIAVPVFCLPRAVSVNTRSPNSGL